MSATKGSEEEANNSPMVAEDPTEPRFVALASRLDKPDFSCALHLSGDGGRYWVPAQPVPEMPAGAEKCYGPELAFDRKGTLYYLFVGLQGPGNSPIGAFLATSSDRGRSFSRPLPILGPGGAPIVGPHNYMVRMAIDPAVGSLGRLHLTWLHAVAPPPTGGLPAQGNPILAAYSDDGGKTFSSPVQVSDPDRRRVVAPALTLGPDGDVHIAYYDLGDDAVDYQGLEGPTWEGHWSLVISTSRDAGKRFERGVVIEEQVVPPGRVILIFTMPPPALAGRGHKIYAAWPDARHGDPDVLLRRSMDGGRTWQPAQRVNDDATGNGAHQSLPRVAVAPNDRVDLVFYDRRRDRTNTLTDVYYAFSSDSGRRFSPNARLTSKASNSKSGPTYEAIASAKGLVDFGSRLGLLSGRSGAVAAWADNRNYPGIGQRQDLFSARLTVPRKPEKAGPLPWFLGGSVVVVGAGGLLVWRARRSKILRLAERPPDRPQSTPT